MKTRAEVVAYLVSIGKPKHFALVAIDQGYNWDDSSADNLCRRSNDNYNDVTYGEEDKDGMITCDVTERDAIAMYDTFEEMMYIEGDKVCVDGDECCYTMDGVYIEQGE